MRRMVYDMLLKFFQTQWENKEKMMQHIMVIVSMTIREKPLKEKLMVKFREQ